ncbi:hypothetical protein Chor_014993 [Crotalus horridus]
MEIPAVNLKAIVLVHWLLTICLYYQVVERKLTDTSRFCTGMAIFSLLLKPLSCYFAYQMYRERGGEYALNLELESPPASHLIQDNSDPNPFPLLRGF